MYCENLKRTPPLNHFKDTFLAARFRERLLPDQEIDDHGAKHYQRLSQ